MNYCSSCGNVMDLHNNYGSKRLYCRYCKQEVIYGHKNPEKDREKSRYSEEAKENKQEEHIVECKVCTGAWYEKDLIPDSCTMYGAFYICPNCRTRIFVRF